MQNDKTPSISNHARDNPNTSIKITKDCIDFDHAMRELMICFYPFLTYDSDVGEYNAA